MSMVTRLCWVVTYHKRLPPKKSHDQRVVTNHVVLQDDVINQIHYNSTTGQAMTKKLGKMVAHLDGLLPIKSTL